LTLQESDITVAPPAIGHDELAAIAARVEPGRRTPRATYRLQFHKEFTFRDAERLAPYLAALGISHLYASPVFRANPGSMHGYDVVDYGQLNPEIGDEADFNALVEALHRHEMGLILDFVPNHMGIASGRNAWWQDVLENGRASPYAGYFDIDWQPLKPELQDQVLLPVLGDHYGIVLEQGELELRFEDGDFKIWYYELPLPVAPSTYPQILRLPLEALAEQFAADDLPFLEYQSVVGAFDRLAARGEEPLPVDERIREQLLTKRRLALLLAESEPIAAAVKAAVRTMNGVAGEPSSFDALDALIEAQFYRLSSWRVAAEEINYRRFFAINELAAIRQEEPEVFARTHELLLRLIAEGKVDGVRIDHPDGLWDPTGYFRDLQRAAFLSKARAASPDEDWDRIEPALSEWWDRQLAEGGDPSNLEPVYLVVEKIVEHGERVPTEWLIDGTVGYEFAHAAGGLLVDSANRKAFDELYGRFAGDMPKFADLVYSRKQLMMRVALVSELNVLARELDRLSEHHRRTRDFTLNALRFALREIIVCFPVYRTYVTCDRPEIDERDRRFVEHAVREAIRRNPAIDRGVFAFIRDILLLNPMRELSDEQRDDHCRFVMKFQQLTGPVMAKGLEDTAFYIYNRLTSLNEVGGDPATFGVSPEDFHRQCLERTRLWPNAMLTSSTHDTKRSEDVRARISALSEMPREWRSALNRWARFNRKHKTRVEGAQAPDRNDEYLFYQALLGVWPFGAIEAEETLVERLNDYMLKAIHEAQTHSSWINPNEEYDGAVSAFVRGALSSASTDFLVDFREFHARIARLGVFNALTQQLLKLTAPGVPDIYQGTELWDFSLVDPDNRRPVDFDERIHRADMPEPSVEFAAELIQSSDDGRIKLYVTRRALDCRRSNPELFAHGDYAPLHATGHLAAHVIAYARRHGDAEIVVVAPRLVEGILRGKFEPPVGELWGDAQLPLGGVRYRNIFTGQTLEPEAGFAPMSEILASFPVAILECLENA
jgi:(1->4)-alpha-D-glucan 1-alpha-D-glucosylmutase